jgi:hypothetical protein
LCRACSRTSSPTRRRHGGPRSHDRPTAHSCMDRARRIARSPSRWSAGPKYSEIGMQPIPIAETSSPERPSRRLSMRRLYRTPEELTLRSAPARAYHLVDGTEGWLTV